ncbi:MAG: hypothetical protein AAGK37_10980 [Pseudomonadota bacterium]
MTSPSSHARLDALLADLTRVLPETHGVLLEAEEFQHGAAALRALASRSRRDRALARLSAEEAAWIAGEIDARWRYLEGYQTSPFAGLVLPNPIWSAGGKVEITVGLAVEGLQSGWEVKWSPQLRPLSDTEARLQVNDTETVYNLKVRVIGRSLNGKRSILVAEAEVRALKPKLIWDASAPAIVISDGAGTPAADLKLTLDGVDHVADARGKIAMPIGADMPRDIRLGGMALALTAEGSTE